MHWITISNPTDPLRISVSLEMATTTQNKDPAYLAADRSASLIIPNTIFVTLAIATVILRLIARKLKRVGLGADDWLILIAMVRSDLTSYAFMILIVLNFGDRPLSASYMQ